MMKHLGDHGLGIDLVILQDEDKEAPRFESFDDRHLAC
jgi:hypothetical protein